MTCLRKLPQGATIQLPLKSSMTPSEIQQAFNVSRAVICFWRKRGFPRPQPHTGLTYTREIAAWLASNNYNVDWIG